MLKESFGPPPSFSTAGSLHVAMPPASGRHSDAEGIIKDRTDWLVSQLIVVGDGSR